jgi:hypothetical protein
MTKNRIFFAQHELDGWLSSGSADLFGDELSLREHGRRFSLIEAVHVLREVSGAGDPFDVSGRVKSVEHLLELGAELLGDSMVLGECAFHVVPGWLGTPVGTFAEHVARRGSLRPVRAKNDDELIVEFLSARA